MGCQRDTDPLKQLPEAGAEWWLDWSPKHEEAPTSPHGHQWLGREQGQEGASAGELQAAVWLPHPQGGGHPSGAGREGSLPRGQHGDQAGKAPPGGTADAQVRPGWARAGTRQRDGPFRALTPAP